MQKMKFAAACLGLVGLFAAGCRSATRPEQPPGPAGSLVYSPAERITAERDAQAARPPAGEGLRTGVRCRIHLRRDAIGLAGGAPLPIVGTSILSERASLSGVIQRIDADAILFRVDPSTYWIPRDVILAVEFPDERRP